MEKVKPTFSKNLFWEYDINDIDMERHASTVVIRVLERGTLEDWRAVRAYYPMEVIADIVVNARSLEPTAMTFASVITHIPIEQFRCYKLLQSNPELSFY